MNGLRFALLLILSLGASAQLRPPPPALPVAVPGEAEPFSPETTREAEVLPELKLELPGQEMEQLDLVSAIELAWTHQPDILEAQGQLRQSEGEVVSQRSGLLPSINLTSQYSHITTNTAGGSLVVGDQVVGGGGNTSVTTDRLSTRIGFRQVLFDFGRTRNLVMQADLLRQSALASVLSTKNDVALEVKENFYQALRARRLVAVREDDVSNRQKQLRLAEALYEAGEMAPGDVVTAQSALTNSIVNLNTARLNAENARQLLVESLGLPPLTPFELLEVGEADLTSKDLDYLLEKAKEQRPDLLAARREFEARKAGLGAAYALNKPEVSHFTGVTYQGNIDAVQAPTLTSQLTFSFDLYDGGARAGAVKSAEGSLEISRARLSRTELSIERLVGSVLAQLLTAERNVDAARAGVKSAKEGVRIAEGRYRVALGTLTDVLVTQTSLVAAQVNLVESFAALDLARARLRHALAAPFEEGFRL